MVQLNTTNTLRKSSSEEEFNDNILITSGQGSIVETTEINQGKGSPHPEFNDNSDIPTLADNAENSEGLSIEGRATAQISSTKEEENSKPTNEIENTITVIQGLRNKIEQNSLDLDIEKECLELINLLHQKTGEELSIIEKSYEQKNANLIEQIEFILPFLSEYMLSCDGSLLDHNLVIPYLKNFLDTNTDMFQKVEPYIFYYANISSKLLSLAMSTKNTKFDPISCLEKLLLLTSKNSAEKPEYFDKTIILISQVTTSLVNSINTYNNKDKREIMNLALWVMTPFTFKGCSYAILYLLAPLRIYSNSTEINSNKQHMFIPEHIISDFFFMISCLRIANTFFSGPNVKIDMIRALENMGLDLKIQFEGNKFTLLHLALHFEDVHLARYLLLDRKLDPFKKNNENQSFADKCNDLNNVFNEKDQEIKRDFKALWQDYNDSFNKKVLLATNFNSKLPRSKQKNRKISKQKRSFLINQDQNNIRINHTQDNIKPKDTTLNLTNQPKRGVKTSSQPKPIEISLEPVFESKTSANLEEPKNHKQTQEKKIKTRGFSNLVNDKEVISEKEKQPTVDAVDFQDKLKNMPLPELSELAEKKDPQYKLTGGDRRTLRKIDKALENNNTGAKIKLGNMVQIVNHLTQSNAPHRVKGDHNNTSFQIEGKGTGYTIPGTNKSYPKIDYIQGAGDVVRNALLARLKKVNISEEDLIPKHLKKNSKFQKK